MKKVPGRLTSAVMKAKCGPIDSGMPAMIILAIASTILVSARMPMKMPAAKTMVTTGVAFAPLAAMRACCSLFL